MGNGIKMGGGGGIKVLVDGEKMKAKEALFKINPEKIINLDIPEVNNKSSMFIHPLAFRKKLYVGIDKIYIINKNKVESFINPPSPTADTTLFFLNGELYQSGWYKPGQYQKNVHFFSVYRNKKWTRLDNVPFRGSYSPIILVDSANTVHWFNESNGGDGVYLTTNDFISYTTQPPPISIRLGDGSVFIHQGKANIIKGTNHYELNDGTWTKKENSPEGYYYFVTEMHKIIYAFRTQNDIVYVSTKEDGKPWESYELKDFKLVHTGGCNSDSQIFLYNTVLPSRLKQLSMTDLTVDYIRY